MEIRQIRYFLAVQETGSFTKAAEKMFVTQPALSTAIKALEEELGAELLVRKPKRISLTPAGLRFRDRAFAILAECNAAKRDLMDVRDQRQLRLGVLDTLNTPPVNALLHDFRMTYPDVLLHLHSGSKGDLAQKLGQDKVDLLITSLSGEEESHTTLPLYQERFVLFVHRQHPLATRASVHLADLHELPFVLRKNCEVLNEGKRVFLSEQAQPHLTCRTEEDGWALSMVQNNLAAAIMGETINAPDVVKIPIVDFGLLRTVGCLWRAHSDPLGVKQFTDFAAQKSWAMAV
ncbi:LysR family transcriptional regulator [Pontibacterium granulatum]|uniref:LysR family transcriptional regulator n=1 Tax=Pontibacterium granulatum TaxID=2036029 RepID=UPI00249BB77C|nr:LysR family transcriptional regulator [Pontibacterium granulatum]MDI3326720.1 LysR family transcriptional regulator [Pontibacterium granulatum]